MLFLAVSGCTSIPGKTEIVESPQEKLPPPPADVMVERKADFLDRLIQRFSLEKPAEPTK